ncbi:putative gustatory receptor 28b [Microplitis demolitor]|uniref:putative gustatory receptor 28b n=1 Tax=Microplitis demolitor TaxID=69319 RepID=UPI00235B6391|nr:putative gustatory receptor 28b [Microplitis demolitor]
MINGNPNIASCAIFGFWALLCIYPAIVLTNSVTSVISEINRTGNIIYKLAAVYSTHTGIKYQLEQFSVELLHKNISFTAHEMIPLDNTLLTSVFGSIVTYIIILLQSGYNTKK